MNPSDELFYSGSEADSASTREYHVAVPLPEAATPADAAADPDAAAAANAPADEGTFDVTTPSNLPRPKLTPLTDTAREIAAGTVIANRFEFIEPIGRGGFGTVYLANDLRLKRLVAVKRSGTLRSFVAGRVREEARAVASLNHANIVSIYDLIEVGRDDLLIVMEFLEGESLATRLLRGPLAAVAAVDAAIQIVAALQHAHQRKLVHSDLKPANVYLTAAGPVKLLDFGLAVAYVAGTSPETIGGTAGYMAPEQLRGESHLIDGRTDLWGLGAVLYEMLTGQRPFRGSDHRAVFAATLNDDPTPPRQLVPELGAELQRIVLKCLSKRRSERYDAASSLLADLQHWRSSAGSETAKAGFNGSLGGLPRPEASSAIRLRQRGLRAFSDIDGSVYRELIPGPRDRNGIPESIRFWLGWVESDDAAVDYPVGILYGPSGAGKTSFVRAGLLPILGPEHCNVYLECRPGDLAGRLTRAIEAKLFDLPSGSSLLDVLTRVRTDESSHRGFRKLLIVLDQFEAWSRSATLEQRQQFADALRQCDGVQLRALIITRDDYWLGVQELLRWLELPLQEGRNMAAIDLLDPPHARRILELIGREDGVLPPAGQPLDREQAAFIFQAVDELTTRGAVICVHLVMFAQMVRLQQWTPRGLRACGGVAGACAMFFEELFDKGGNQHSPEYRRVADAVPTVLNTLLPPEGSSVVEMSVGRGELLERLQEDGSEHLLDDSLRVLTDDLRLVTAVAADPTRHDAQAGEVRYRLAHDFLAAPVEQWVDRLHTRTWRGRTRSRLSEISSTWARRQTANYLPSFWEFLSLMVRSRFVPRTELDSRFLRASARFHAGRISALLVAVLALIGMTAYAVRQSSLATASSEQALVANVDLLLHAPASDFARHIAELQVRGEPAVDEVSKWKDSVDPQSRLRSLLFLNSVGRVDFASIARLIETAPADMCPAFLSAAKSSPGAADSLRAIAAGQGGAALKSRAALLLIDLGDAGPLSSLLVGSQDAAADAAVFTEATQWRGGPEPFAQLLESNAPTDARYSAAVILGSYPRAELEAAGVSIDTDKLINDAEVTLHSAGQYLAAHLGKDPAATPLAPPPEANWRVGPEGITMARVAGASLDDLGVASGSTLLAVSGQVGGFWIATTPVSLDLYNEFARFVRVGVDGSDLIPAKPLQQQQGYANLLSQPVLNITSMQAHQFCNWLSERDGLRPAYRFLNPPPTPPFDANMQRTPPSPAWADDRSADGYRLPTAAQFVLAAQAGYRRAIPSVHALRISRAGGGYAEPITEGDEAVQPLYSLIPNRRGLFSNDGECGSWVAATAAEGVRAPFGLSHRRSLFTPRVLHRVPSDDLTIYLVSEDPAPTAEGR